MHLFVLGIHGVFRQRLQMLPAAQRAEPPDVGAIMDREVAAVAFAEHRALGMGRPQLAALGDGLAVGADQPLRDIKAAAVAFGQAEHRGQLGALDGAADLLGLRAVIRERIVEIALHEAAADRPGRRAKPDLPRISGNEGLGKRDQLGAVRRQPPRSARWSCRWWHRDRERPAPPEPPPPCISDEPDPSHHPFRVESR